MKKQSLAGHTSPWCIRRLDQSLSDTERRSISDTTVRRDALADRSDLHCLDGRATSDSRFNDIGVLKHSAASLGKRLSSSSRNCQSHRIMDNWRFCQSPALRQCRWALARISCTQWQGNVDNKVPRSSTWSTSNYKCTITTRWVVISEKAPMFAVNNCVHITVKRRI